MKYLFIIFLSITFLNSCGEKIDLIETKCSPECNYWEDCDAGECKLKDNMCVNSYECNSEEICDMSSHYCVYACNGISCSNHGICGVNNHIANCICDNGYFANGLICVNNLCENITCSYHGTCIVENNSAKCNCDNGYIANGLTCVANNLCENITCSYHGTCVVENNSAKCNCNNGYIANGLTCVANNPCENITCCEGKTCNPINGQCEGICDTISTIVAVRAEGITISDPYSTTPSIGEVTDIEGVVVAILGTKTETKHGVFIRQINANEFAGIYVDFQNIKTDVTFTTPSWGNFIKVSGTHKEYFGFSKIIPIIVDQVVVVSYNVTIPAPINITVTQLEEKYESMLVNLTGGPFTVIVEANAENVYTTTLKNANNQQFRMKSDVMYPKYVLPVGTILTKATGVVTYDYGYFKILPRNTADLEIDDLCEFIYCSDTQECNPANGQCVDKPAENTAVLCSDGISNDGDIYIDCDDYDCTPFCGAECTPACETGFTCQNGTCIREITGACVNIDCGEGQCIVAGFGHYCQCNAGRENRRPENIEDKCVNPATYNYCDELWSCSPNGACIIKENEGYRFAECECEENYIYDVVEYSCELGLYCGMNVCNPLAEICREQTQQCVEQQCSIQFPQGGCGVGVCDNGVCVETGTIYQIRQAQNNIAVGDTVKTTGIVMSLVLTTSGYLKGIYIQSSANDFNGIYIYINPNATSTIAVGDNIEVTGINSDFHGLNWIETTIDKVVIGTHNNTLFTAKNTAVTALGEANESMLVNMTDGPFTVTEVGVAGNNYNTKLTDANGNIFYMKNTIYKFNEVAGFTVGTKYSTIKGIVTQYDTVYSLQPRNANDLIIFVPITCNPNCSEWQECTAINTCTLKAGRCGDNDDCTVAGQECNMITHICANPQFANGDFSVWTSDTAPESWTTGNFVATFSKVTRSGTDYALNMTGTSTANLYILSSILTAVSDTKPVSITFEMNGSGKMSINIACDIDSNGTISSGGLAEQRYYNLTAETFAWAGVNANSYVEFNTTGTWKTFTVTTGTELDAFWKSGSTCRIEIKGGKDIPFNASIDNVVINY